MLLSKLKVIIQSTNFIFHVPWKMVRMHTAFLITDYFNSSNLIILWICVFYKHSFIFLTVFVSPWLHYSFLLYSQRCQNLKNIRTIYPPTVYANFILSLSVTSVFDLSFLSDDITCQINTLFTLVITSNTACLSWAYFVTVKLSKWICLKYPTSQILL